MWVSSYIHRWVSLIRKFYFGGIVMDTFLLPDSILFQANWNSISQNIMMEGQVIFSKTVLLCFITFLPSVFSLMFRRVYVHLLQLNILLTPAHWNDIVRIPLYLFACLPWWTPLQKCPIGYNIEILMNITVHIWAAILQIKFHFIMVKIRKIMRGNTL